jgi:hypothetical protein
MYSVTLHFTHKESAETVAKLAGVASRISIPLSPSFQRKLVKGIRNAVAVEGPVEQAHEVTVTPCTCSLCTGDGRVSLPLFGPDAS